MNIILLLFGENILDDEINRRKQIQNLFGIDVREQMMWNIDKIICWIC